MDSEIGSVNMHYDACMTCKFRDEYDECAHTAGGPSIEYDEYDDRVTCLRYKKGDPKTPEEIAEEARKKRFQEVDKFQVKLPITEETER